MNKSFNCDKEIKKVVFLTPADKMYVVQSIEIMKAIKEKFPKSELICYFIEALIQINLQAMMKQ
ncbi:hypothetical protein [Clostridium sp.]|uniref:hypothetical protein n=1 Tax=Clostridium sp. TaxID=1506 RepID=UPI003216D415